MLLGFLQNYSGGGGGGDNSDQNSWNFSKIDFWNLWVTLMFRIFWELQFLKFESHRTLELLEYYRNISIKSEYVKSGVLKFFFELFLKTIRNSRTIRKELRTLKKKVVFLIVWVQLHRHSINPLLHLQQRKPNFIFNQTEARMNSYHIQTQKIQVTQVKKYDLCVHGIRLRWVVFCAESKSGLFFPNTSDVWDFFSWIFFEKSQIVWYKSVQLFFKQKAINYFHAFFNAESIECFVCLFF